MKESEYIDVADLARLRVIYTMIGATIGKGDYSHLGDLRALIVSGLDAWIADIEPRVRASLREEQA